jgi:hypothetical protein
MVAAANANPSPPREPTPGERAARLFGGSEIVRRCVDDPESCHWSVALRDGSTVQFSCATISETGDWLALHGARGWGPLGGFLNSTTTVEVRPADVLAFGAMERAAVAAAE